MTSLPKRILYGSIGIVGLVAVASVADIVTEFPFGRYIVMDVIFLVAAGIVIYLAIDALAEQK